MGLLAAGILLLSGVCLLHQHRQATRPSHLANLTGNIQCYQGTIVSEVQEKANHYKAELAVASVKINSRWKPAEGKVLVYLAKSSPTPQYGDKILLKGSPQKVPPPANPGEFDYQGYLAIGQIHHQHFAKEAQFMLVGHHEPNPVFAASLRVRERAKNVFRRFITTPREYAIAVGLVLGLREGMDEELKAAYASAGAMHVLAVSGAHVVIVFWIVASLLGFLKKIPRGRWVFAATSLLLLWFYAFVTGLSSSVLRAVVMFSFVIIADVAGREKSNYNFLAASAFFLLCANPWFVLDVGFQLSYAAVLGIIYLHPRIYAWFDCKTLVMDKIGGMTSTCLAAQIGVLPFTLFYFHQFPVYFLLANLVVIPLSSAILYAGIALLAVAWIPGVSIVVAAILEGLIWLLNQFALLTYQLPGAIIGGFFINKLEFGLLTGAVLFLLVFLQYKRLWQLAMVLCLLSVLILSDGAEEKEQVKQQRLAIYSVKGHSAIGVIEGKKHLLVADSSLLDDPDKIKFHLQNDWLACGVNQSTLLPFGPLTHPMLPWEHQDAYSLFTWGGKRFIILHKPTGNTVPGSLQADVLIVRQNSSESWTDGPTTAKKS